MNGEKNVFDFVEVGDVCDVGDGAHAKVARQIEGVMYLTSKNIGIGQLKLDNFDYISQDDYNRIFPEKSKATRKPQENDILLGIIGTFGNAYLYGENDFFGVSSSVAVLRAKQHLIFAKYLFYVVTSENFRLAHNGFKSGSAQGYTNIPTIKRLPVPLPPLEIQQKIASILRALDDKIELNRRTNATLETIAQTLFKSWFVDFDPVKAKAAGLEPEGLDTTTAAWFPSGFENSSLDEIPEGWAVESLSMQLEILSGGTPKTTELTYWDGEIPWVAVPDTASGVFITQTAKTITALGLEKSATQLLPAETIVITARGTVGKCAIISKPMTMNQSCYGLRGKKGVGQIFLYFQTLNQVRRLQGGANGSVFDTITRSSFDVLDVIRPSSELLKAFEEFAKPIFQSILQNQLEIESLTITRDSLLPKLLSGEISVEGLNL
jgi:type I restriction enzyme, S subunit